MASEPALLEASPAPASTVVLTAALVARQASARDSIAGRTVAVVAALWRRFASWYDEEAVLALAWESSRASRGGQQAAADLSSASMRQALALLRVQAPAAPVLVPQEGLRGIDFLEEWSRPAVTYRYERSAGTPEPVALQRAVERATQLAEDDVSLASRQGSRAALVRAGTRVTGYRRVIHPELSRGGTCGLCIVASDRLYSKVELLPVHGRCRCETLPVVDGLDPATPISQARLEELYRAAGSTYGPDLKRVRVQFDEHSELGPVLAPAGQHVRSEREGITASRGAGRSGDLDARTAQLEQLRRSLPTLERLASAGAPGAAEALAQRRARIASLAA